MRVKENTEQVLLVRALRSVRNTFARSTMWQVSAQDTRVQCKTYRVRACCVTYVVGECARTRGIYTYTRKAYGPFARKPCPGYGAEEGGRRKEVAMFFPLDVSLCFLFAIFHRETFSASLDPLLRKSRLDPRRGVSRRLSIIRVRSF